MPHRRSGRGSVNVDVGPALALNARKFLVVRQPIRKALGLSDIDRRQVPFDEAVALWCEMRYAPIVDIIRRRDALREFPGRTEADLYLWLCRNQAELQADYEHYVLMEEAADDLGRRFSSKFLPLRYTQRAARWMVTAGMNWAGGWRMAARRALRRG